MSWSVSLIGTPEAVNRELDAESARLSGQSKEEFDAAAPHLKALLLQNFDRRDAAVGSVLVKLEASGHGTSRSSGPSGPWEPIDRQLTTKIERFYAKILT